MKKISVRKTAQHLKSTGKAYIGSNGIPRPAKQMRPPCSYNCRISCYDKFDDEQRKILFDEYYQLADVSRQWEYLGKHIDKNVPKRKPGMRRYKKANRVPTPVPTKKRGNNNRYFMRNENDEQLRVCKTMFLNTFDISEAVVESVIRKTNDEGDLIDGDRRGRFSKYKKGKPEPVQTDIFDTN